MIKRKKVSEYSGYLAGSIILILIGISIIGILGFNSDYSNLEEEIGYEDFQVIMIAMNFFAVLITLAGVISFVEIINYSKHPEKYNYCKRCKHIISLKKGKFCNSCTYSIEGSLERNNEKYFKDYKKNYKERYLKLKTRMKKK